jgi:predicted nucleotide-binding protein (sugar kinase/HSP70/actin superfamily)
VKIGIPRALLFYHFFPMWKSFFEELGHEVVFSDPTNKSVMDEGVKSCVDDACLPVKLFHGHVLDLSKKADTIFIPRLSSIYPGEFICPKFMGLPEMIRDSIRSFDRWLVLEVNAHKNIKHFYNGYELMARKLCSKRAQRTKALETAKKHQREFERLLIQGSNPLRLIDGPSRACDHALYKGTVGVVSHPYLIYDVYASMNLLDKLEKYGYRVLLSDNISSEVIRQECSIFKKDLFWSYGKKLLGSGLYMMKHKVDGIIFLSSFGCGIDALIEELLRRINQREYRIPYTMMTVDEHSGHAGFDTRLEAFLDMMEWRNRHGDYVSSYGESLYIH